METVRRFLVLTPVVFGVTVFVALLSAGGVGVRPEQMGFDVLFAVVAVVVVLAAVLVAVAVLRLLGVRSAWAALGLAFCLAVVALVIICAVMVASMLPDDEGWSLIIVFGPVVASVPTWVTYAVGLVVGDWRSRVAQERATQDGDVNATA